ncbi:hypothetical protein DAEQUDRAFT_726459 [Daedalea quercina L-15889]|uniref:Uncharacterized protein n=1 Tax=Daedalea quercina L-15889 TaxID=1314783 RepID=A0A165QIB2_9APHY|nr:hypothetical protein DAEQUDRAFT_726459 [Daedalea quercina L-15889]
MATSLLVRRPPKFERIRKQASSNADAALGMHMPLHAAVACRGSTECCVGSTSELGVRISTILDKRPWD